MKKLLSLVAIIFMVNIIHAQWQSDLRLTNDIAGSWTSGNPASANNIWCIAANGNNLHVVWYDYRDGAGTGEIYYKRSTDGGITWGNDTRLTNDPAVSINPSVTVSGSVVHVVWQDSRNGNPEIYYKYSADGGLTWTADTRLTNDPANSWNPSITVSGSDVYVLWQDFRDGNFEIYYKKSTDNGINWSADMWLTNDAGYSSRPSVTASGTEVHVVWHDTRDGNDEIYYKNSINSSNNWSADKRLSNDPGTSQYPSIAVSGSSVHVVWNDNRDGNYELYYKQSTDGGINWGADIRLTNDPNASLHTSIAACGSAVHVVWYDNRDANFEIHYKNSTDGGTNWGTDTRLTNNNSYSWFPSIAVSSSGLHVIWTEERDGNDEIYYKRNLTGCNTSTVTTCDSLSTTVTKSASGNCCWSINLTQPSNTSGITGIQFSALAPNTFVLGSSQLGSGYTSGWLFVSNNTSQFTIRRQTGNIPGGQLNNFFNFCLNNLSSPQYVAINWLNAKDEVVCSDTVSLGCDIPCVTFGKETITCASNNNYTLQYYFANNTAFTINKIDVVKTIPAGITITPATITIPSVLSNQTSGLQTFTLSGAVPNTTVAIIFRVTSSDGCCSCTDTLYVKIPSCMCREVGASLSQNAVNCCSALNIFNNYAGNYFTQIKLTALTSGVTFNTWNTNTTSNWYSQNTFAANIVQLVNTGNGFIPSGNSNSILNFCLSGYTTSPQKIIVEWMRNDSVKCTDTLTTTCVPPPPVTYCVQLLDQSITCKSDGSFEFKFKVKNNSTYTTTGFQLNPVSPALLAFSPNNFSSVSIAPSMTSAEQTLIISGISPNTQLCFEIALYEHIYQNGQLQYSWCCHSDTICIQTSLCGIQPGSICGFKYNDLNGNGLKDEGEPILSNWQIILTGSSEMNVTTDDKGNYCFKDLKPGKYTISERAQTGWVQTTPATGTYSFELLSGQNIIDLNFGNKVIPSTGCVKPPSEMVAWWPLDETSITKEGSVSNDLAGFNNIGTRTNGPIPLTAKVLGGLQFDGTNDYIEVPDHQELNFDKGDFTIDAWILTKDNSGSKDMVDKRTSATSILGYSFFLINGKLSLQLADGTFTSYGSPVFVADGRWHHIAVTVSRTDQKGIIFYLDGVPVQYGDPTLHPGSLNNKGVLRIGSQSFTEGYHFQGNLDEVEMFKRVLSKDEIVSIFTAGTVGKCKPDNVGIEEYRPNTPGQLIRIYPNPASTTLHVNFNNPLNEHAVLTIQNILGIRLLSIQIENGKTNINLARFYSGFYNVRVVINKKLIYRSNLIIIK